MLCHRIGAESESANKLQLLCAELHITDGWHVHPERASTRRKKKDRPRVVVGLSMASAPTWQICMFDNDDGETGSRAKPSSSSANENSIPYDRLAVALIAHDLANSMPNYLFGRE